MPAAAVDMSPTTRLQHVTPSPVPSRGSGQNLLIEAVMRSARSSRQGSVHSQPESPATKYPGWMTAKSSQDGMVMSRAASEIMSPKQPRTSQSSPERALSRGSAAVSHAGSDTRRSMPYTGSDKSAERRSTGASRMSISVGEMLLPSDTHRTRPPQEQPTRPSSEKISPYSMTRVGQGADSDSEKPQK
jgi:hypothetical protein